MSEQSGAAFHALADHTRREILDLLLSSGPLRAGDIAAQFNHMTRIAISKHLRVLREAELVEVIDSEDARERHYTLNAAGFDDVRTWLRRYDSFWQQRLSELKRIAEERDQESSDTVS